MDGMAETVGTPPGSKNILLGKIIDVDHGVWHG
jgi:hypothetical protein